ncbi:lipopolysaccharide biosynthesis protein [Bacteroides graminisolvens]|uniref:lipopolysaccharide biosynthesis protein n=1 Tax=Bacteroides graminisolvens TaxID=477666 RepID=UPI000AE49C46|nr:lipopolysaccharide biosynthesis protein [Bacteroides graminisolvens]
MKEQSLKQKTVGALLWNLLDRMGQQVLLFIVGIIVANILSVEDYALVGMLAIFTAIANIVLDSGFSSALIRKQDATEEDYSSVFYFNLSISVILYAILFFAAPYIAQFYNQPLLTDLTRIIFLSLPFNSLSLIQNTLLNKKIEFKRLAKINFISLLISGGCSLAMAYNGLGVWTLAWQPVILSFSKSALLWMSNQWRPKLIFQLSNIQSLFGFASSLLLASLINSIFTNIYSVAIGKLYPTKDLGYYSQGNKISLMVISSIYSSLQAATYPIFSSIQDDKERSIRSYRKTIRFTAFLTFPLMIGLVSIAEPLISILLKKEWAGCIPFFQLTCIAGIFTILTSINQNFIKVYGRSDVIFKLEIVRTVLIILGLLVSLKESALVMIGIQTLIQAIIYLISIIYIGHSIEYSWTKQLKDILPYTVISVLMWGLLVIPEYYIGSYYALLLTKMTIGILFYYITNKYLGSQILREAVEILFKQKSK